MLWTRVVGIGMLAAVCSLSTAPAMGQQAGSRSGADSALRNPNGTIPPSVVAIRAQQPPDLDGILDDDVWRRATPVSGFRRDVPSDGAPAAERTEVRVAYDDRAVFIGARLFASDPSTVSRRLGRRDAFNVSNDEFQVIVDSHHDHRTAFLFGVTPAGGRNDAIASGDTRGQLDPSWDPVWEVATRIDSLGWIAEIRIPLSQLRFSKEDRQVWGIQFRREIFSASEVVDWAWTSQSEPGWVSNFGHLLGIENLRPPSRLEVLPHVVGRTALTEGADPANPFDHGSVYTASAGADIKYGVTNDLTLDATINPDFGQVDADPAVINLTQFETFFPELRPFFVEGANIFDYNILGHRIFYSRRIGRAPSRSALGLADYVDQPAATTILGAAKMSGKTQSGLSIGVLDALTAPEYARTATALGERTADVPVEPLANYAVVRVQQDLRDGTDGIGAILTSVHRDLSDPSFLSLTRSAYTGAVDFLHRFKENAYSLSGNLAFSHLRGEPAAMRAVQRSSVHYFQRPDQGYLSVDSLATSMSGSMGQLQLSENKGNWTFLALGAYSSPGFENNDIGYETGVDRILVGVSAGRRWLEPRGMFRYFQVSGVASQMWTFGGVNVRRYLSANFSGQTTGLWNLAASTRLDFTVFNDRETRSGPLMQTPPGLVTQLSVGSDARRMLSFTSSVTGSRRRDGTWSASLNTGLFLRSGALGFSVTPTYSRSHATAYYVTQAADAVAAATYGSRYVFAALDRSTLDITLRADWAVTPSMTLQAYVQPLVATGDYERFQELAAPSSFDFIEYGVDGASSVSFDAASNTYEVDADGPAGPGAPVSFGNPDFRVRSLRSNVVLRWEYLPGSTLYVAWSQDRFARSSDPSFQALSELGHLFTDDMRNVFLVKVSYWLSR
jgi:hypothetical protein